MIVHVILGLPGESREDMLAAECVALLPEDTVLHRMTGDGPRRLLIAPLWSLDKKRVLNTLNRYISAAYDKTSSRTGERLTSIEKFGMFCYNSQLQVQEESIGVL